MKKQQQSTVEIAGTTVDLNHPDVQNAKTTADIAKLQIFSHLDETERLDAEKQLKKRLKLSDENVQQENLH